MMFAARDRQITACSELQWFKDSVRLQPGDMSDYGELLLWDDIQSRGWLLAGGQLQVDRVVQTIGDIRLFGRPGWT